MPRNFCRSYSCPFLHFFAKFGGEKKGFSGYTSGRSIPGMFGQVCRVSCDGEQRLDVQKKLIFIPLSLGQHECYSRGVQGLGRQPPSGSFRHVTTLHGHIVWHPVTLCHFFFLNDIFPLREPLSYNSSLGLDFWLLILGFWQALVLTGLAARLFPIQCAHLHRWALCPGDEPCPCLEKARALQITGVTHGVCFKGVQRQDCIPKFMRFKGINWMSQS